MRPLYLEMTAFGSYADKTEVPFEELKHGLYLVTGETGAGKTTIFDAIMFALYGVASGQDRRSEMLHCDYVPKSEDAVVSLRFAQNGKEITVTRRMHFRKKRGTENEYGDAEIKAELREPDCAPIEGASNVTRRIEALLGLNAEQFSRIIMLAQGEFRRFLKANSDEKNEILGKLFDNSAYLYYQNLILEARARLKDARREREDALRAVMETVFLVPPDLEDGARERFLPGNPALLENLNVLTEAETLRASELRASESAAFARVNEASQRLGAAEAVNEQLAALRRDREKLSALEARSPEIARRTEQLRLADDAFHRAAPAVRAAEKARTAWERTVGDVAALQKDLRLREQVLADADRAVTADAPAKEETAALQAQRKTIADQLPQYLELEKHEKARADAERNAAQAREEIDTQAQARDALDRELAALAETLEALAQVDLLVQSRQTEYDAAKARQDEVRGERGLCADIRRVWELEESLRQAETALRGRTDEAADAAGAYHALYQRFIASQAGVLAERLRTELAEQPSARCPVCGTQLCRDHLPQLAVLPEETPDEQAVEAAKQKAELAERARGEQHTAVQTCVTRLAGARDAVLARAPRLFGEDLDPERLFDPVELETAAARVDQRFHKAESALNDAKRSQSARDEAKARLAETTRAREAADKRIEALRETGQRELAAAQAAQSAADALRKTLLFADASAAEAERQRLTDREAALSEAIRAHEEAREAASRACSTAQGALLEKQSALETRLEERDAAAQAEASVLRETGFASREAALTALAPIGETDGEAWLRAEREALAEYRKETATLRESIAEQARQTAGLQTVDLAALSEEKRQLEAQYEAARAAHAALANLLQNHTSVLHQVEAAKRDLAGTDGAWRRLDRLAAIAGGASSEQGKLSFDRYVMGAMFREILEMANRRMELMSGGRYELVHKTGADRRNAKAGLEIEVLDHNTGVQRPSGSLSGGEGFFTSLALALGLSDVVQNHAGGRQLDALFIDEGFGSLSYDVLDKALDVLGQLTEGNRLVGIISHVDRLDESIPQKIRVQTGERGSTLKLETA